MKYIKFVYVLDPVFKGPVYPAVTGLRFVWARESMYPTNTPEFFGTCPDDADVQLEGVLGIYPQAEWERMRVDEMARRSVLRAETVSPPTMRDIQKAERRRAVERITVTTAAGNTFDGDEISQTRMTRAIVVLSSGATASVPWVLHDNTVIQATAAELTEALALSGAAQAAAWVI